MVYVSNYGLEDCLSMLYVSKYGLQDCFCNATSENMMFGFLMRPASKVDPYCTS